jgi:hypothetical protein
MNEKDKLVELLPLYTNMSRRIVFEALEDKFYHKQIVKMFKEGMIMANKPTLTLS